MNKDIELSATAATMAKNIEGFVVITIGRDGQASVSANGNVMQICYMEKSLESFVHKLINGEIRSNA